MTDGVTAPLSELIALKRYAERVSYRPEGRVMQAGNHLSKLRGRGMEFSEVRNYQAGDEIRHMEWRVTARTGRPHVKLYQEERERPVVILVDFSPSMFFGTRIAFKSVIAARLAAILAWTAVLQGDRLGALVFSERKHNEFIPRGREGGVLPFLAMLSQYTSDKRSFDSFQSSLRAKTLSHALLRVRRVARPGTLVVLMSDFYSLDKDCEASLSRLRSHNDVLAYHVCDPLEIAPPKPERYALTNGQQDILLDTSVNGVNCAYQDYCEQRLGAIEAQCLRMNIPYEQVTAETDLPRLVHQTFPWKMHHG